VDWRVSTSRRCTFPTVRLELWKLVSSSQASQHSKVYHTLAEVKHLRAINGW
jgi:hypothetical protein